jgi:Flp pilus assembly protein TadD
MPALVGCHRAGQRMRDWIPLMRPTLFVLACAVLTAASANAQTRNPVNPFDARSLGVVMGAPGTDKVKVRPNVVYLRDARDTLAIDLYLPADLKSGQRRPVVVFLNAIGDTPGQQKVKDWGIYTSWPRLIAAHGMIGASMETDAERIPECLKRVFEFLATDGAKYGVDGTRMGCYAASANVTQSSNYLLGDSAHAGIRAAVLYYGGPPQREPRRDLPVLFVAAESDAPRQGEALTGLWRRVVDTKAPWDLVYAAGLPHAFDAAADDENSLRMVRRTIDFWRAHLEAAPPAAEPPSNSRAMAAALFWNDPARALPVLDRWIAEHPDDASAWVQKGRMLAAAQRFDESTAAYEKAQALGANDPGLYSGLAQVRMNQKRWAEAAELFEKAIAGGARNSLTYGQLGWAQLHLNRNEDAVRSYEQSIALGIPPGAQTRGAAHYNLACGYVRIGNKGKALDALTVAVEDRFGDRAGYEGDSDLTPLKSDPRWKDLIARLPAPAPASR